ncbi:hypothetical protein [Enhygromyxa salina]|uniref:Uncharacterized protein n=1 Tax=Enhygromyxa salina TaxID=215803 RepID=A0A2S9YWX0_9BACT|nr:hypothetical protein [Enhygromyxa salina]PRQ09573.1 hypothetical protein ENSA7_06300 [Enhygromyxa salina]
MTTDSTRQLEAPRLVKVADALLVIGFVAQLVLGHAIAFGFDGPLFAWHQDRVARSLWGTAEYGLEVSAYRGWIQAVFGGTLISYAWAMLFLVAIPLRRRERWAAWAIAIATLNWVVVDTAICLAHGVWINVAFNAVALTSIGAPLAMMIPWLRAGGRPSAPSAGAR